MAKDKREQILGAASECFKKYGYRKTTLDDIGSIVGLDKSSIYYYFKSKAEIYITLTTNEYRTVHSKIYAEIEDIQKCETKILTYFEKRIDWLYAQSNILTQITPEELNTFLSFAGDIVAQINLDERVAFRNILEGCINKNEIQLKNHTVDQLSNYIFALADGIYNQIRRPDDTSVMTQEQAKMIKKEIVAALSIFINGMR